MKSSQVKKMKIGYSCINWTLGCKGDKTFRLKAYSDERLIETVGHNLDCLAKVLEFNVAHEILIMLYTNDKEKTALKAVQIARNDGRFVRL